MRFFRRPKVDHFDGLQFPGLGRALTGPTSGITTFEEADRLLTVWLGHPPTKRNGAKR